jgi:hypothetical protein
VRLTVVVVDAALAGGAVAPVAAVGRGVGRGRVVVIVAAVLALVPVLEVAASVGLFVPFPTVPVVPVVPIVLGRDGVCREGTGREDAAVDAERADTALDDDTPRGGGGGGALRCLVVVAVAVPLPLPLPLPFPSPVVLLLIGGGPVENS